MLCPQKRLCFPGLQKAVLSVQGVIAVFSSERGKAKTIFQLLEAWHHGKSHYQLVGGTERQETTKRPRNFVCHAGNCKMPAIELCADFNDQFLGKPQPHQSYLYRKGTPWDGVSKMNKSE